MIDVCDICEKDIPVGMRYWDINGLTYCRICYIARFGVPDYEGKVYTVWVEDSDEATDYLMSYTEAQSVAKYWKEQGYRATLENVNTGETYEEM
jgi:hypothetical protein